MSFSKLVTIALLGAYPHDHPDFTNNACLADNYYGTYGSQSVFILPQHCYGESVTERAEFTVTSQSYPPSAQLVWIEQAALDERLLHIPRPSFRNIDSILSGIHALDAELYDSGEWNGAMHEFATQDILADGLPLSSRTPYTVLHTDNTSALVALPPFYAHRLSFILPSTWRLYALPATPVPLVPVPDAAVARVRALLDNLKFDPVVSRIVSNISLAQAKNDVRWLTGEDGSGIESRHSFSQGARDAAEWLKVRFEETGATCELRPFLMGFAPNVICRYLPTVNTTATVLISAHYDSRGSFGSTRAPGGDDDGSGTTGLLAIARTIKRLGITFQSNVELVAFAGEEQGLYGSRFYAQDLKAIDANLTLMIQADMTAYHEPGEPPQLGLPETIGTKEVTQLVANISAIYSPELKVGFTPACCSDHQSFHSVGFPASQVFERAGPIADPMYHNSGDLSDRVGYDLEQLKSIAKVQFATLLHAAGFNLP